MTLPTGQARTTRDRVLSDAGKAINGDRARDYGSAAASFERVAALWSVLLDRPTTATEVAQCLALLKISRSVTSPKKLDNWVDLAGYSALAAELAGATAPGDLGTVTLNELSGAAVPFEEA